MKKIISMLFALFALTSAHAATTTVESTYSFTPTGGYTDVPDVNTSGFAVDMAILGHDAASDQPIILIKDADTDGFIRYISIFDSDWAIDPLLKKVDDANSNGYSELAVKATNSITGEVAVQLVDSYTGLDVNRVVLVAGSGGGGGGANTYSLDLESTQSQHASISDANQTGLDLSGDFTIELWVKLETNGNSTVVGKWDGAAGKRGYALQIKSNNQIWLYVRNAGDSISGHGDINYTLPAVGTWFHVAGTYDVSLGQFELFINGVSQGTATGTLPTSILNSSAPFTIGAIEAGTAPSDFTDGSVDDVRVWNLIRTQAEISAGMNQELTGSEAGLVGYWKFNNDYQDSSPNRNHLTPANSPVFAADIPY